MQENNEQVVTEEVKPVEYVPVDEIVGQSTESNSNNIQKGRSPRELILVIIAALTMIASGLYFTFTSEDDEESSSNNSDPETVEKEETKKDETEQKEIKETEKEDTTSETDKQNKETTEIYIKPDENGLKQSSTIIADMFIFATQFGFKTGKVADFDNKQLINMTLLYLQENSESCFDKQYFENKAKELFGVGLKSDNLPAGITFENNKYCKASDWGAGGNTNPLTLSDSKVVKKDSKVVYKHIYSYENNNTTIELEYKLEKDHYVLVSVSKK